MQVAAAGTQLALRGEAEHYALMGDWLQLQVVDGKEVVVFNRQALSRKNAQGGMHSKHEEETQVIFPNTVMKDLCLVRQVKLWQEETRALVEEGTDVQLRKLKRERTKSGSGATDEDLLKEATAMADAKVNTTCMSVAVHNVACCNGLQRIELQAG